jgi:hypothetical protein
VNVALDESVYGSALMLAAVVVTYVQVTIEEYGAKDVGGGKRFHSLSVALAAAMCYVMVVASWIMSSSSSSSSSSGAGVGGVGGGSASTSSVGTMLFGHPGTMLVVSGFVCVANYYLESSVRRTSKGGAGLLLLGVLASSAAAAAASLVVPAEEETAVSSWVAAVSALGVCAGMTVLLSGTGGAGKSFIVSRGGSCFRP